MTTSVSEQKIVGLKRYPVLDLVRFIAALLVIFIHIFPEGSTYDSVGLGNSTPVLLGESFVHALLRAAVPLFFIISSFLLFKRINANPDNKWKYIGTFCLRLLFLYLFWYIVALPITIRDITNYMNTGDIFGLVRYIVLTLYKGAPRGFWFLVALALSVLITSLFNNKKSLTILLIISGLLYIYGCFNSAYYGLFTSNTDSFSKVFVTIGDYLELSFCILEALIFVALGKVFALHNSLQIKGNIVFIIISFILMVGELFLTLYFEIFVYPDAFFLLPVFIFFLMNKLISINADNESFIRIAKKLKKVGSFSYLFHIQFFYYLHLIFDASGHNIFREQYVLLIIPYIICVLMSFGLQTLFEYLSKYRFLRFLKYSY